MNFASMLRLFGPAATLVAIRSAVHEPPAPRYINLPQDPWFGGDPLYLTAWAGVVAEVPA